jgi:hypothetical protein
MLDVLAFHSIKQQVKFNTLIFLMIFKIKNNLVPEYMKDVTTYNRDSTTKGSWGIKMISDYLTTKRNTRKTQCGKMILSCITN